MERSPKMYKLFLASVADKHWEIVAESEEEVVEILIGSMALSSLPVHIDISEVVTGGNHE